jgi:AraC-like DNA-binding protein
MFTEDDLTIQSVESVKAWNWPNRHPRLCFVLPTQGRGIYSDEQTTRPLTAGDVMVLSTCMEGVIRPVSGRKMRFYYFFARLEHLVAVFTLSEFCLLENSVKRLAHPWYYPAGSTLARKCHELLGSVPATPDLEHRCHLLKLVGTILAEEFNLSRSRSLGENLNHNDLLNHLSLEEIQNSSIKMLADKYQYSRRHLNRIFHERFGISVSALKMELRLIKAVALLRDPSMKLMTVAGDCGFNHLSLFSARFKKRFGTSPSQWREQCFASLLSKEGGKGNGELCPLRTKGFCPLPGQRHEKAKLIDELALGGGRHEGSNIRTVKDEAKSEKQSSVQYPA